MASDASASVFDYMQHKPTCAGVIADAVTRGRELTKIGCTCGLADALAQHEAVLLHARLMESELVVPLIGDDEITAESLRFWRREYEHYEQLALTLPPKLDAAEAESKRLRAEDLEVRAHLNAREDETTIDAAKRRLAEYAAVCRERSQLDARVQALEQGIRKLSATWRKRAVAKIVSSPRWSAADSVAESLNYCADQLDSLLTSPPVDQEQTIVVHDAENLVTQLGKRIQELVVGSFQKTKPL